MYLQESMHRLVDSFKLGFLSDRITKALSKYEENGGRVSSDEEKILNEGVSLVEMVLSGRKQITTGTYESNALESLMIYNKSLSIVLDMPNLPSEINAAEIEKIFNDLKNNLARMAAGERVSAEEVRKTKIFFDIFRKATLDDSTTIINGLYESRSSLEWELPPET